MTEQGSVRPLPVRPGYKAPRPLDQVIVGVVKVAVLCLWTVLAVFLGMNKSEQMATPQMESLYAQLDTARMRANALQDSVFAGEIEGFGLRCYLVREE